MRGISILFLSIMLLAGTSWPSLASDREMNQGAGFSSSFQKLAEFSRSFPQQKAYLHTDKNEYFAGETIWFQAYLVSGRTHAPDTSSTNLFVELVNTKNEMINLMILRLNNGFASGFIQLEDSLPAGNYQIKAYTNWMNNFDKDFIFSKNLFVINPAEENYIGRAQTRHNRNFNSGLERRENSMQFEFFPEGGHLVAGFENRVAFKAADALGAGQQASGMLLDRNGIAVSEFETFHDGMGWFSFSPQPGETYTAQIQFKNGQRLRRNLPAALAQGYQLRVEPGKDMIRVSVNTNFDLDQFNMSPDFLLLAHTRGRVGFVEEGKLVNGSFQTNISTGQFPDGITHFTLFGPNETPVAERLVFISDHLSNEDSHSVAFQKRLEDNRIVVDFWFDPANGLTPSDGNYSLSVTEEHGQRQLYDMNIATYLLLSSDFGTTINDPLYYFLDDSPERLKALDMLMLTHGWRRFVWKDILAGKFPEILYSEPQGLALVGQVTPISSARETGELRVEMSVGYTEDRKILSTTTDMAGRFAFTGLEYYEDFTALLSIQRDIRGRIYRIDMQGRLRETSPFRVGLNSRPHETIARGPNWQRREQPNFLKRWAQRAGTGQEVKSPSMFGKPDQVIYMEDLSSNYTNVMDILRDRVTGLTVIGGEITLRGPSSIRLSNEPLFYVDEVLVSRFSFLNIAVGEIERIEVLRGPSTAILGSRGANGALFIYTRRAEHQRQFSYEYQLRGYHATREFFVSQIDVQQYQLNEVPRTILWVPEIVPDLDGRVRIRIPYGENYELLRFRLEGIDREGQVIFLQF